MPFQIIAFAQLGSHVVGQAFALGVKARVDARLVAARIHAVPALAVVQPNRIQAMETCSPGIIVAIAEALITQCRGNTAGTEYCGEQVRFRKTDPVPVTNDVGSRNADLLGSDVVAVGISVAHRFVSSTDCLQLRLTAYFGDEPLHRRMIAVDDLRRCQKFFKTTAQCSHPHPSSRRTFAAPSASACNLPKAVARGRYFIPQSGAATSRSAGM